MLKFENPRNEKKKERSLEGSTSLRHARMALSVWDRGHATLFLPHNVFCNGPSIAYLRCQCDHEIHGIRIQKKHFSLGQKKTTEPPAQCHHSGLGGVYGVQWHPLNVPAWPDQDDRKIKRPKGWKLDMGGEEVHTEGTWIQKQICHTQNLRWEP